MVEKRKNIETGSTIIDTNTSETKKQKAHLETLTDNSIKSTMGSKAQPISNNLRKKEAGQPAKKLVIKNLKVVPKLPDNFEEETWKKLQASVRAVYHSETTQCSLEELYKACEDLCYHKMSASLYSKLQTECENHVKEEVKRLLSFQGASESYLSFVNSCWQDYCSQMIMIRSIFLYLDRTYVIQNASVRSLWDMGLQLFRTHVFSVPEIEKKVVHGLISLIEKERHGETVDRSLLKNLLRMLVSLQLYSDSFEPPFLESTRIFYSQEAANYLRDTEVAEYLRHAETRLANENDRVLHYLDPTTRKPLILVVEKQLLEAHVDSLLAKGFNLLMSENRIEDLARLYHLLSRVNALDALKQSFNSYVKATGISMIDDVEKEKTLVQDLLDFRARLDVILEQAFHKNEAFAYSLKEAFEVFINKKSNKPAELIAKFVDSKLRSGNKGTSEEEIENILDRVMILFRYIHGKDVFEAFYKKDLAKRLLLGKSASFDAEKTMISKLKSECGSSFTNKLEGMFKDIDLSKDILSSFKQSAKFQEQLHGDIELSVSVLTAGYWPPYAPLEVNLPKQLAEYQDIFKQFYLSKYSGRRLMWQNSLGHCVLKSFFSGSNQRKELAVSLLQTVVLLLFNDGDQFSYKEIHQATGMEHGELKRTLQSLACGKVRVLSKEPKGKDIGEDDTFSSINDFKHKLYRIKINSIQMKETVEENTKTTQGVMQDRQYQIDAAIVRIMKTRKKLNHNSLVSELFGQLKFPVKAADLKKRIESLIEREYLERDTEDSQIYNYLA